MAQKVISININSTSIKSGANYEEMEFDKLNKYLEDTEEGGYKIVDVHQIDPSESSNYFTITFILEKV